MNSKGTGGEKQQKPDRKRWRSGRVQERRRWEGELKEDAAAAAAEEVGREEGPKWGHWVY